METYKLITKEAFDSVADEYINRDKGVVDEAFDVKSALTKFMSLIPQNGRALDIGTGGGRDSRFLHENGFHVTGIDISQELLSRASAVQPEIDYRLMDFEHLDFPDNQFDGIWANASLHHIPKINLPNVLKKISSLLKEGGILFIKMKQGTKQEGIRENEKFGKKIKRYFAYYTKEELGNLLIDNGFNVIDTRILTDGKWVDVFAKKQSLPDKT